MVLEDVSLCNWGVLGGREDLRAEREHGTGIKVDVSDRSSVRLPRSCHCHQTSLSLPPDYFHRHQIKYPTVHRKKWQPQEPMGWWTQSRTYRCQASRRNSTKRSSGFFSSRDFIWERVWTANRYWKWTNYLHFQAFQINYIWYMGRYKWLGFRGQITKSVKSQRFFMCKKSQTHENTFFWRICVIFDKVYSVNRTKTLVISKKRPSESSWRVRKILWQKSIGWTLHIKSETRQRGNEAACMDMGYGSRATHTDRR